MGYRDIDYKPKILKNKFGTIDVKPSHSIYYDWYAYKAVFDADLFENYRQRLHFKRQLEDFELDMCTGDIRSYVANNGVRVYIREYSDFQTLVNMFHSQILWLAGPRSKEHLELMTSRDFFPLLKKSLFFKEYDCKIWLSTVTWNRYRSSGGIYGFPSSYSSINEIEIEEQLDFFKQNLSKFKTRTGYYGTRSSEFYCDYAEFINVLPFFKLQWPNHRMVVRKVLLEDKY